MSGQTAEEPEATDAAQGARTAPEPPQGAAEMFGTRLQLLVRYAGLLAGAGVERGLIGPREVDRLWERHLMNCAVLEQEIPDGAWLVDVGSGAGLPGLVLAASRPDLRVTLLEPLLRRTVFLAECIEELELTNVEVIRGRAEEWVGRLDADVVTARAVAPLDRLAGWCLPLLRPSGVMLALKGESAQDELDAVEKSLTSRGVRSARVVELGGEPGAPLARAIRIELGPAGFTTPRAGARRRRGARG